MLASKYASAPPDSPKDSSRRSSSAKETKPLPPLPSTPNGTSADASALPSTDSGKRTPASARSRNTSREQNIELAPPLSPRLRRTNTRTSVPEAKLDEKDQESAAAPPLSVTPPAMTIPVAAPDALAASNDPKPQLPAANAQSRDMAPTPEPPRAELTRPVASIPAKKITSKRGRPCVIRIPANLISSSERKKQISTDDFAARLKQFEAEGYNVRGYDHEEVADKQPDDGVDFSSKDLFERLKNRQSAPTEANEKPVVVIPDRKKWDEYRNFLVEEKLRALGVLAPEPEPEPEEPEATDPSLQDSNMFPGMAMSPPPMSSSVNSQHQWQGPAPFSAPFSPAGFTNNTSIGGMASPVPSMGGAGMQRPGHLSRQSTYGFPFPAAFNPALQQQFSPQPGMNGPLGFHRGASPSLAGNAIPRLASAMSRHSPDIYPEQRQQTPRLQSAGVQMQPSLSQQMKGARRTTLMSSAQNSAPGSAEMTPQGSNNGFGDINIPTHAPASNAVTEAPVKAPADQHDSYTDLAYPTPRGHRHNISKNLEIEAEKPQYYPGEYVDMDANESAPAAPFKFGAPLDAAANGSLDGETAHWTKPSHTSTGSTSKFNVEAKEFKFDPKAAHARQASMTKNPFMPEQAPGIGSKPAVSFVTAHANGETTGEGNFDAVAGSFKPPTKSDFSFASSAFNFSKKPELTPEPEDKKGEGEGDKSSKSKIFSGISFADFVKPTKKSKAIPIVNPNALPKKTVTVEANDDEPGEDEYGRITQDKGRHKRGRTAAPGDNDIPRFATPSSPGLTPQPEDIKTAATKPESTPEPALEPMPEQKPEPEQDAKPDPVKEDDAARWSDFGIDAPQTPPARSAARTERLIDTHPEPSPATTSVPRLSVEEAVRSARQNTYSLLDSSPPRIPSPDHLPRFPGRELDPSFQEIDAIMEQLNEQPLHGAEEAADQPRVPSPSKNSVVNERLGGPSPELRETKFPAFAQEPEQERLASQPAEWVRGQRSLRASASPVRASVSPVRKLNSTKEPEISDWDEMLSDKDVAKFMPQAQFFDTRVKSLIEGILQQHLSPLQKAVRDIDTTVKSLPARDSAALVEKADKTESDADDEDNADEPDVRPARASHVDRKMERLRALFLEAVASQHSSDVSTKREIDSLRSSLLEAISSARAQPASVSPQIDTNEIRRVIEESMAGRTESSSRLEDQTRLRHDAERKLDDLQRMLDLSEKEISLFKESADKVDEEVQTIREEKDVVQQRVVALEKVERELRLRNSGLTSEVSALQGTLEEYRISSTRWRNEIDSVKTAREGLQQNIDDLKRELHHSHQSRENMGAKLEKLQEALSTATTSLQNERQNFRARDEELSKESAVLGARLEEEFRTRQRLERELDRQGVHERNAIKASVSLEEVRTSNQRLLAEAAKLREENANERNSSQLHEREAIEAKDIARAEIQRTKTLLDAELEVANRRSESIRTDLETRLEHVREELETSKQENYNMKQDFDIRMKQSMEQRTQAVREASESANAARQAERSHFERLTEELSKQHDDAMKRMLDERQRAEVHFNETLKLSHEKNTLLEDKAKHLEDKVSVAQSAAKAAAEAAQQQASSKAKDAAAQREHLRPSERVSPQALRESIVVLQEQLQEREGRIESLESELNAVDKDLPNKFRDRETEITWLRELLNVRLDDISELVNLLSLESYDRIAARDAAIRIRANLQMEQQEKERLIGRTTTTSSSALARQANNPLPTLTDLQNFATPRAAQIAAAWGNWRKTGQSPSLASLRSVVNPNASDSGNTPTKPDRLPNFPQKPVVDSASAAQTFLSGLMTPPASNMRRTPTPEREQDDHDDDGMSNMSDAQPLSLAAELGDDMSSVSGGSPSKMMTGGRNGRPRTPQTASGHEEGPVTPPIARKASYDLGAEMSRADAGDEDDAADGDSTTGIGSHGAEIAAQTQLAPLEG